MSFWTKIRNFDEKGLKYALPVIGTAVGGPIGGAIGGAVGGALNAHRGTGNLLRGAGIGGVEGGLAGLAAGALGGINPTTGISAIDSANSSILSPFSSITDAINGGGALSAAGEGGASSLLGSGGTDSLGVSGGVAGDSLGVPGASAGSNFLTNPAMGGSTLADAGGNLVSSTVPNGVPTAASPSSGILAKLVASAEKNPFAAITSALQVGQALNGTLNNGTNANSQADIIAAQKAAQAKNAADGVSFVNNMNNASSAGLNRTQTNPNIDYYTYGERPQASFYNNVNPTPIPTVAYARGGLIPGNAPPALPMARPAVYRGIQPMPARISASMPPHYMASGGMVPPETGALGLVPGNDGGQADTVPANVSPGEFVVPADAVAHLGDGNSKNGGERLHHMVSAIRAHKATKGFPPKAKNPQAYMGA